MKTATRVGFFEKRKKRNKRIWKGGTIKQLYKVLITKSHF